MPMANTPEECLQRIRDHRSSESNFETLCQTLREAKEAAQKGDNNQLADSLQEIEEKYAAEYKQAKETGGTAWPEFEKFVTQFERALTNAKREVTNQ